MRLINNENILLFGECEGQLLEKVFLADPDYITHVYEKNLDEELNLRREDLLG